MLKDEDDGVGEFPGGSGLGNGEGATGYVAGSQSVFSSILPSSKYAAVVPETVEPSPKASRQQEPFEVELLSDIEGAPDESDKRSSNRGRSEDRRWMQDIFAVPNRAVVMSYFCVGFAMKFLSTPLTYFLIELGAEPNQQNVVWTLVTLPWSFKLVYGFISDNFPIAGFRRKPYFIIGWTVFATVNFMIAANPKPSIQALAGGLFVATVGFMLSDVVTDAILVERSKQEVSQSRGHMQAMGYTVRFVGSLLGSIMGTLVYNKDSWGWGLSIQQCFLLNGLFPVLYIAPWVIQLRETRVEHRAETPITQKIKTQCADVFRTLEKRAVYQPMAAIFLYNVLQVPNAAWRPFLQEGLGFEPYKLGILGIIASFMSSAGLLVYRRWFFRTSWRRIYVWTTVLVTAFSALQLLLIFRINLKLGINDLAFSAGDDSISDLVIMIQFLPVVQMYLSMCPDGAEGTTYAILTTMSNVAGAGAYTLGTLFTKIWDVRNETLKAQDFDGMWKLTLLTSLIQLVPLVFIRMLPANQAEQRALQMNGSRNAWGGVMLLVVLFTSLAWTVYQALKELGN